MRNVFISKRGWVAAHRRHKFNLAKEAGRVEILEVTPTGTLYQCHAEDYRELMRAPKFNGGYNAAKND